MSEVTNELESVLNLFNLTFNAKGEMQVLENPHREFTVPDFLNGVLLKVLGSNVFASRKIEILNLNNGLVEIGNCAFYNNNLRKVLIPNTVKKIGYLAFAENPLKLIEIPSSVEYISEAAFAHTTDCLEIICEEDSYAHHYAVTNNYKFNFLTAKIN